MVFFGRKLGCALLLVALAGCGSAPPPATGPLSALTDPPKPAVAPSAPVRPLPVAPVAVAADPNAPLESGRATWYKRSRHTHTTASGEALDDRLFTAAHRSLPLGSFVRVSDLATGNAVIVRVNDRGPFTKGFIIDLSKSSADALGLFRNHAMIVSLEPLETPPGGDHPSVPVSTLPTGKAALAALTPPKPKAAAKPGPAKAAKPAPAKAAKSGPAQKPTPAKPTPKKT